MRLLFLDILTNDLTKRQEIETQVYDNQPCANHLRESLELSASDIDVVDASTGVFPSLHPYDGMIIGGSIEDAVQGYEKPWMHPVYAFIRKATQTSIPILGICGGMQFTIRALGGRVVKNPRGRHFNTNQVSLTSDGITDPLFEGLPTSLIVQSNHRCMVDTLPYGARPLAQSDHTPIEAIAIDDTIRLVQFHPEATPATARRHARLRREQLIKEGYVTAVQFESFINSFADPHGHGKMILKNFVRHFVLKNDKRRSQEIS